jgi:hypothetical protein
VSFQPRNQQAWRQQEQQQQQQQQQQGQGHNNGEMQYFGHDPMTAINFDERHQSSLSGLPIPVGMFMNMTHIPPRFYNQQQGQQGYQGQGHQGHHGGGQKQKGYYRAGGASQENQGSSSQVL